MTLEQFMENYDIKNKKKVLHWIDEELIPRANKKKNYVPDSARPPYTSARAKKANAIYVSIVKASLRRYHVLPKTYKICEDEFQGYITRLENAKCIEKRISDGITYYDATLDASECTSKFISQAIKACAEGVTAGIMNAVNQ